MCVLSTHVCALCVLSIKCSMCITEYTLKFSVKEVASTEHIARSIFAHRSGERRCRSEKGDVTLLTTLGAVT